MDNGLRGDFELVYNGEGVPKAKYYEAMPSEPGRPYRFYVIAIN